MDVDSKQILSKKIVGKVKGSPVYELITKGGLTILATSGTKGIEYLGAASHIALSKYIAETKEPSIIWTELSKGGEGFPKLILEAMAKAEKAFELTNMFNELNK